MPSRKLHCAEVPDAEMGEQLEWGGWEHPGNHPWYHRVNVTVKRKKQEGLVLCPASKIYQTCRLKNPPEIGGINLGAYPKAYGDPDAQRTAQPAKRDAVHTAEEWKNHPLAGHGYTPETGWTHPEAQRAHEAEVEAAKAAAEEAKKKAAEKDKKQ